MDKAQEMRFVAGEDDSGKRLDRVLRRGLPGAGLSAIYSLIRRGGVRVNGERAGSGAKIRPGDEIVVKGAPAGSAAPSERPPQSTGMDLPSLILFENDHVLAIAKPTGRTVHGPNGLDGDVRAYLRGRIPESVSFRPGPCHRLDRGTTGVLLFSKSLIGARAAFEAFSSSSTVKVYAALLDGKMEGTAHWIDSLTRLRNEGKSVRGLPGGKKAETFVLSLDTMEASTIALMRITTGRNHQIRAQSSERGHPLSGDAKYEGSRRRGGFILHCALLGFRDEAHAGILPREVSAPLPRESATALDALFGEGMARRVMAEALRFGAIELG